MLPPILPASLEDISPLYPFFKLTPTSLAVKNIFEKQSPKINTYTAYNTSYTAYKTIKNMQNTILRLHEIMMSYSGYEYAGKYKIDDNLIIEEDKEENRKIRYKPVSAKETPKAMEQLVLAYMDASNNSNVREGRIQIIGKGKNARYIANLKIM